MKCKECDTPVLARGLCSMHYVRLQRKWRKQGFIDPMPDDIDYDDFWEFVKKELNIA